MLVNSGGADVFPQLGCRAAGSGRPPREGQRQQEQGQRPQGGNGRSVPAAEETGLSWPLGEGKTPGVLSRGRDCVGLRSSNYGNRRLLLL